MTEAGKCPQCGKETLVNISPTARGQWASSKFARMTALIVSGTLAILTGIIVIQNRDRFAWKPVSNETQADKVAGMAKYERDVAERRKQQAEEEGRIKSEAAAVVGFESDAVKLHPQAFAGSAMSNEHRAVLEAILTNFHRKYLDLEFVSSCRVPDDGKQVTLISISAKSVADLENELWTEIDTQLPVEIQKLLRESLPLYIDPSKFAPEYLRYQHVLGWKPDLLPILIEIDRRGKWYRWTVSQSEPMRGTNPISSKKLDSDEAPELPWGLRRFDGGIFLSEAKVEGSSIQLVKDEGTQPIVRSSDGIRLSHPFVTRLGLDTEQTSKVDALLNDFGKRYFDLESLHTKTVSRRTNGLLVERIHIVNPPLEARSKLIDEFWTRLDSLIDTTQFPLLRDELPIIRSDRSSALPGILGWDEECYPVKVILGIDWLRGPLYRWGVRANEERQLGAGTGNDFPAELDRYWNLDSDVHDTPEAAFQRFQEAYASRDWNKYAECFTDDARDELSFESLTGALLVYALSDFAIGSGAKQSPETLTTNVRFKQFVKSVEQTYEIRLNDEKVKAKSLEITEKLLQNRFLRAERRACAAEFIREIFGGRSKEFFMQVTEFFHSLKPNRDFHNLKIESTNGNEAFGSYVSNGSPKREPIWFLRADSASDWKIDGLVDISILNGGVASMKKPEPHSSESVRERNSTE